MNMINRKQMYTNQTSSRWKKVNKIRHFTVIADLNVAQKKNLVCGLFLYVSFIIVKDCGFVMGFVIFSNIFSIKTTIFNVKT